MIVDPKPLYQSFFSSLPGEKLVYTAHWTTISKSLLHSLTLHFMRSLCILMHFSSGEVFASSPIILRMADFQEIFVVEVKANRLYPVEKHVYYELLLYSQKNFGVIYLIHVWKMFVVIRGIVNVFFVWNRLSPVLEHAMRARLASVSQTFTCLFCPSAEVTDMCHHCLATLRIFNTNSII